MTIRKNNVSKYILDKNNSELFLDICTKFLTGTSVKKLMSINKLDKESVTCIILIVTRNINKNYKTKLMSVTEDLLKLSWVTKHKKEYLKGVKKLTF